VPLPTSYSADTPARNRPIRVVIADDAYLVREALERILATADSIDVVASCSDRESLLAAIHNQRPAAIVTDIRMPPTWTDEGIQVARALRQTDPEIGVVVLSQYAEPGYVLALLESGSAGRAYLMKERLRDAGELVSAISAVAAGESVIDPVVVEVLVRARARAAPLSLTELTARERDVLAEIAQGKSNAAIARSLFLTKRAVEKHVNAIFMKLELGSVEDVSRRVKAALMFLAGEAAAGDGAAADQSADGSGKTI
jgi:DNA-binding NarL/FixJ family response regulator